MGLRYIVGRRANNKKSNENKHGKSDELKELRDKVCEWRTATDAPAVEKQSSMTTPNFLWALVKFLTPSAQIWLRFVVVY
jgi:hypothetical protein